jgi:hypothetical protein
MEKSCNDINAQVERCIALANELGGKWTANAHHRADVQYFAQIGRRVKTQRGIPMFAPDRDRKYPLIIVQVAQPKPEPVPVVVEEPKPAKKVEPTPTEKAKNMMSFTSWMNASEANRKSIQDAARHAFIRKMYAELLTDYTVCQLEGWDMFEFPRMLREALTVCFPKQPKQLSLFPS